ncbi:MAG: DUF885 domain-containing protein [Acidimicrobiales bacterium]
MSRVFDLSSSFVDQSAALDPFLASRLGIAGSEGEVPDLSPAGLESRMALIDRTLEDLGSEHASSAPERVASDVLHDKLASELALYEAGETFASLRVIGSPVQSLRSVFDNMPRTTEQDWAHIAQRMAKIPRAVSGYIETLRAGVDAGNFSSARQASACADQCASASESYYVDLAMAYPASADPTSSVSADLEISAKRASEGMAALARFLREEYLPRAPSLDGVGADRYALWAGAMLGMQIDAHETYEWGWAELRRIEAEMANLADRVIPGASTREAVAALESDDARAIVGADALRAWLQALMDQTVSDLDGAVFDIPGPLRQVEAMIAPPGGAAAMYYTAPSEDFSRPGRTWYPTLGKTRFPLWGEMSIAYHEGVPGHHLQLGTVMLERESVSRFARTIGITSGHVEGWALYAERLMAELGVYEGRPEFELGLLRAQALRAARVVVDLGLHLGFAPPSGIAERWSYDVALEFIINHGWFPPDFLASEITRYLGWPSQAISYKVGERVWLGCRERAKKADAAFDLKAWHRDALALGNVGLGQLERELALLIPGASGS